MTDASKLPREFRYNNIELEDPGPQHDAVDVRNLYSATYPEIVSAAIEGPELKDGKRVYTFRRAVGTKGAAAAAGARASLQALASGQAKRPRGNAVLPDEHAAAAPFAKACAELVSESLHTNYGSDEDLADDDVAIPGPGPDLVLAAPEALPPLP